MVDEFRGAALPLDKEGLTEVTERLGVGSAELWAVLTVETRGCGFLPDRRPVILFERHVFSRETAHAYDAAHPDISNPRPGGYGSGGATQYQRLHQAVALDRRAALRSASWGIGQLMGFNAEVAGFGDVEAMVRAMVHSENEQLQGMAGEIERNGLIRPLRAHDWAAFARGYNGPAYQMNSYDSRLAAAYNKFRAGPMPDLVVRAAQAYLTYLGFDPGPVDGMLGRLTRSAVNDFQEQHGMPVTHVISDEDVVALREAAERLPG